MGRRRREWERFRQHYDGAGKGGGRDRFEDVADGVVASVEAIADGFSAAADPSERERRRLEKEQRRLESRAAGRRNLFGAGAGLLAGGLAASAGLITVGAVGVGLLAGAGVVYGLAAIEGYRRSAAGAAPLLARRPTLTEPNVAGQDARTVLVRAVIKDAMTHLRAIDRAAISGVDAELNAILTRIAAIGHRVCQAVAEQPAAFDKAQRLLTYHVEKAATLATLANAAQGPRSAGVRRVLGRMELLFEQTEAGLKYEDGRELDLELKLIDQALDEDLRR